MVREIVQYGSKILRRKADLVSEVDDDLHVLIRDLFDSLAEAKGVGLAAPQIGVSRRIIVVDISGTESNIPSLALVNPVVDIGHGMTTSEEGCLSIPDVYGEVSRYTNIDVSALDQNGQTFKFNAEGFHARVLQHEIDHLDGKLFIDHLAPLKRQLMRGALKRIKKEGEQWDKRHVIA